ncbi:MAG TPA: hypothetical protein PLA88_09605 [Bacteroidales bacterium]|nr:hypothetical protein [Bacteroidales bacterium]
MRYFSVKVQKCGEVYKMRPASFQQGNCEKYFSKAKGEPKPEYLLIIIAVCYQKWLDNLR